MRLIAIDVADIALENSTELKCALGCSGSKQNAATDLGSLAYGPLDHAIYDCRIVLYATHERDLAKLHMDRLQELGLGGSLLLFDRWYPSASFLAYTLDAGFSFVMWEREKWNLQVDAVKTEDWVTLTHEYKYFSARVLKIALSTGETETLLTNMNQNSFLWIRPGNYISSVGPLSQPMIPSNPNFSWRTSPAKLRPAFFRIFMPPSTLLALPRFAPLRLMRRLPLMTKTKI